MGEKVEPCGVCGKGGFTGMKAGIVVDYYSVHCIDHKDCGVRGPWMTDREMAERAWNRMWNRPPGPRTGQLVRTMVAGLPKAPRQTDEDLASIGLVVLAAAECGIEVTS